MSCLPFSLTPRPYTHTFTGKDMDRDDEEDNDREDSDEVGSGLGLGLGLGSRLGSGRSKREARVRSFRFPRATNTQHTHTQPCAKPMTSAGPNCARMGFKGAMVSKCCKNVLGSSALVRLRPDFPAMRNFRAGHGKNPYSEPPAVGYCFRRNFIPRRPKLR